MFAAVPKSDERRRSDRIAVERRAVLRTEDAAHEIELLDLTAGGCRFRCEGDLPMFTQVSVGIGGVGHTSAQLVWQADTIYGCAFDKPLPSHAVTATAPDNIARIMTTTQVWQVGCEGDVPDDERLPIQARVAIVVGLSAVLWGGIIAGALAVIG